MICFVDIWTRVWIEAMTIVYLDERMMCAALMFIIDYIQVIKFSASTHKNIQYKHQHRGSIWNKHVYHPRNKQWCWCKENVINASCRKLDNLFVKRSHMMTKQNNNVNCLYFAYAWRCKFHKGAIENKKRRQVLRNLVKLYCQNR